ncbi:hypothetical protein FOC4_g10003221, partial [Fusarium odoratissimum]
LLHDSIQLSVLGDDDIFLVDSLAGLHPDSPRGLGRCVIDDLDPVLKGLVLLDFEVFKRANRLFDILSGDLGSLDLAVEGLLCDQDSKHGMTCVLKSEVRLSALKSCSEWCSLGYLGLKDVFLLRVRR